MLHNFNLNKIIILLLVFVLSFASNAQSIHFNELFYRQHTNFEKKVRFVEIYNSSNSTVSLSDYKLIGDVKFQFPSNAQISANSYVLVCENPTNLESNFNIPSNVNVYGPWSGELSLIEGSLILKDLAFNTIDEINYSGWQVWPSTKVSTGYAIQKLNPLLPSNNGGSWQSNSPSPGQQNNVYNSNVNVSNIPSIANVNQYPKFPAINEMITITAEVDNVNANLSTDIILEYQIVNSGSYIKKSDSDYDNNWIPIVMTNDGLNGDALANDNIFTANIPANIQQSHRLIRYRILIENNTGFSTLYPDQYNDESNFSYYVYGLHAIEEGYDLNALDEIQTFQIIFEDQNDFATLVTKYDVYDHIDFGSKGFYNSGRNNHTLNFNDGRPVKLENDDGKVYEVLRDKVAFSSTYMNDQDSHGLTESLIFKFFELCNATASYADYAHIRFVDKNIPTSDFEGIFVMRDQVRNFRDGFNQDFLKLRNLPNGNIYTYKNFKFINKGINGPYDLYNDNYVDWNNGLSDSHDGCSSCPIDAISQSFLEDNLDIENHIGFMIAQELIANNETNYAGQHCYFEYFNPESEKWQIFPDDFNAVFGAPRNEVALYPRDSCDVNEDVRGPIKTKFLAHSELKVRFENEMRSTIDLLYNTEQGNFLVENETKKIFNPNNAYNWIDPDEEKWSRPYTNYEDVKNWYKNFISTRKNYLNNLYGSSKIPDTPTITYTGASSFPINGLTFTNSNFDDPQGSNTFESLEWRIAEWSDPTNPVYASIDENFYEITPVWTSGEITSFTNSFTINGENLKPNGTYKVRVRYTDQTNRKSRWSDAIQFIAGEALNYSVPDLIISEIMYNPSDICAIPFIEIYNKESVAIDISNFEIRNAVSFKFPVGSAINANEYLVIAADSLAFSWKHGITPSGQFDGELDENSAEIELVGKFNQNVNTVEYNNDANWPTNLMETSISLKDPNLNNNLGQNWENSMNCGTPAALNVVFVCDDFQTIGTSENITCFGDNNGNIDINVSGAASPIQYNWSNNNAGSIANNLSAGNYNVEIIDALGCSEILNFTITEPAELISNPVVNQISAFGLNNGMINLQLQGGVTPYNISWSNGATVQNIASLVAGNYNANITDNNGCDLTESFTINDFNCNINLSETIIQSNANQNGSIDISINNGSAPYDINWSNGENTADIDDLEAGNYTITVIDDNNCSITETFEIIHTCSLELSETIIQSTANQNGSIDISINNGSAPYNINWSNGENTADIDDLEAGNYTITVIDDNNCSITETFEIIHNCSLELSETITTSNVFANGSIDISINNGSAPYNINWSNGENTADIDDLEAGNYTITVIDDKNCSVTETFEILHICDIDVISSVSQPLCYNDLGFIEIISINNASLPIQFTWLNLNNSLINSNLTAGNYVFDVMDDKGCTAQQSFTINSAPNEIIPIATIQDDTGYDDGSIEINIANQPAGLSYIWSNFDTNSNIYNLTAGNYDLFIMDANNCQSQFTYEVPLNLAICSLVNNIASFLITESSANFIWQNTIANAESYIFDYRVIGDTVWTSDTVTFNFTFIQDLEACTDYEYRVTVNCANGANSDLSAVYQFSTIGCNQCNMVSNLLHTNETQQSVILSWDLYPNANYTLYTRLLGNSIWYENDLNFPFAILFSLTPCTTYEWYVNVNCENGLTSSESAIQQFTTLCIEPRKNETTETNFNKKLKIYPNPATDLINIESFDLSNISNINIYDNNANLIKSISENIDTKESINVSEFANGLYWVKVNYADGTFELDKFIKGK